MKILYIAPASFPITSSESIVNAKIAYILANMGHDVYVYAAESYDTYYPDSTISGKQLLHQNIKIRNVSIDSPKSVFHKILTRFKWLCVFIKTGYYYKYNNISYSFMKTVIEDIKHGLKFDIMITRGFYTEMVGINVAKNYSIPWIANWNDPYPLNNFPPPYGSGPNAKNSFSIRKILLNIQKYAAKHTFPSNRLRDYMLTYLTNIDKINTHIIPHVAHSMFFTPKESIKHEKLKLLHAGNVRYPRDPKNFLKALSQVVKSSGYENSIECMFIGQFSDDFIKIVNDLDLANIVSYKSGVSYNDIIETQKSFDMSLIIEAICDEGIYLPTKVADSIQGGLPVFCVSPLKGTQHDLVDLYEIGYFADNTNIDDIHVKLITAIDDFRNHSLPIIAKDKVPYFFEEYADNKYKEIFDELLNNM